MKVRPDIEATKAWIDELDAILLELELGELHIAQQRLQILRRHVYNYRTEPPALVRSRASNAGWQGRG